MSSEEKRGKMITAIDEDGNEHEMEEFRCEADHPWHAGIGGPGMFVMHPNARVSEDGIRRCPTCGYQWEKDYG